jgi:hypothetical protein
MSNRFVCCFAVGRENVALSGVWRVWTAKNQPDLYIAVRQLSGEIKATVHCPRPPLHPNWERHFGFVKEAASEIAQKAKEDVGPHKVRWTGHVIGLSCTVEYRVRIQGKSLSKEGLAVSADTTLLPVPSEQEYLEVAVLLGPTVPTTGCPRESQGETHLLGEGRLLDGRRVWVVYYIRPMPKIDERPPQRLFPKGYMNAAADLSTASRLRAVLFGAQEDGNLLFWDMRAEFTLKKEKPPGDNAAAFLGANKDV